MRFFNLPREKREEVLSAVSEVLGDRCDLVFAYAFGSFLEDLPFRDLDLVVYVHPGALSSIPFFFEDALAQEIRSRLTLPFPVDVRVLNGSPLPFQFHALRGRLMVDRDEEARMEWLCRVVARYLDMKPILDHHAREAFAGEPRP